jgi:hypothetical protein
VGMYWPTIAARCPSCHYLDCSRPDSVAIRHLYSGNKCYGARALREWSA